MQGILPRNLLPVSRINASNVMTKPHPLEHFSHVERCGWQSEIHGIGPR